MGLDISVGIATAYGLDGPGIESQLEARYSAPVQTGPVAHPASYTMGAGSFLGVKRPGRGVDHSPPTSAPTPSLGLRSMFQSDLYLYLSLDPLTAN